MEVKTKHEIGQTVYEIYEKDVKRLKCKTCEGTGKIIYHTNAKVEPKNIEKNCPKCDGLATLEKTCFGWRKSKVRDIYIVIESVTGDKAETLNKRIRYKVLPSYNSCPEEILPSTEKEAVALCEKFNKDEEEWKKLWRG